MQLFLLENVSNVFFSGKTQGTAASPWFDGEHHGEIFSGFARHRCSGLRLLGYGVPRTEHTEPVPDQSPSAHGSEVGSQPLNCSVSDEFALVETAKKKSLSMVFNLLALEPIHAPWDPGPWQPTVGGPGGQLGARTWDPLPPPSGLRLGA